MRIAQVAPLFESVPPHLYGGTERIVSYLTEELVRLGHDVTLFASADSRTAARLVSCCDNGLRLDGCPDPNIPHALMLERVWRHAGSFDVIHFHTDVLHYSMARRLDVPHVTTTHGRLDLPHLDRFYREFSELPLVSISDDQRKPVPSANWAATVHHGLPPDLCPFNPKGGDYLVFTGRISPEKRPDWAIEIARRAGLQLRIAAKVSDADRRYFETVIKPLLRQPHVEFLGEVDDHQKGELLGGALAMLFPIDWPEPFGLVMIESMACGTPVIAIRRGSVPEVVRHGHSGLIVENVEEAVQAATEVRTMNRWRCRQCFDERFTARRMANDYLEVYRQRMRRVGSPRIQRARAVSHG